MQYSIAKNGQAVTVALKGQLNFAANEAFAGLLRDLDGVGKAQVVFDLSGLSHIDSVGLGLLYIAREDLDGVGAMMSLAKPQGSVKRLLELTEAGDTFKITA
jgi:anti-anti-sigma factor